KLSVPIGPGSPVVLTMKVLAKACKGRPPPIAATSASNDSERAWPQPRAIRKGSTPPSSQNVRLQEIEGTERPFRPRTDFLYENRRRQATDPEFTQRVKQFRSAGRVVGAEVRSRIDVDE